MDHVSSAAALTAASSLSKHVDAVMAAEQVCEEVGSGVVAGSVDLAMFFVSGRHVDHVGPIAEVIARTLNPGTLLGVSAEAVVGGQIEAEEASAISLFAASMPGTTLHSFAYRDLPHVREGDSDSLVALAEAIGARRDLRGILFFADPTSVPAAAAVDALSSVPTVVEGLKRAPVIGGMASAAPPPAPGGNVLYLNGQLSRSGGIGLTIRGDVNIDTIVSQGCRPIGKPLLVTAGQRNIIKTLGGRKAIEALRDIVMALPPEDRELLPRGVYVGRVIDEYKPRFGRGDFLIRGVLGVDQATGAIAIGDLVKPGQTIQFHLRDAQTATEDLQLLLAAEELRTPPVGGLIFTCNGRGKKLFGAPNHDAEMIASAVKRADGSPVPMSGFFAAGEIGPVGTQSFVHGQTASIAFLRPRSRGEDRE
ncbi:MAG TPA: FIST N-terminal domain-containing protein [Phycisphaerales bacterium]|nr:FIST N-terminal domain-containing protein [Phycisphaerales bacterium]